MSGLRGVVGWACAVLVAGASAASAQAPPGAANREQLKKLDFLVGTWQGRGWIMAGPGGKHDFTTKESVQRKLGGTVLLIEGEGKAKDDPNGPERVVHQALAMVGYDADAKRFRFSAYRANGSFVDADAKVSDGVLEWGFRDGMRGHIRFIIKLDKDGRWFETGEFSPDGNTWHKFFEMTLTKVS